MIQMYSNYRWKLFFVLLTFAIVVTVTISFFDYLRLKEEIVSDNHVEIEHASNSSINALYTIEKVYELLNPQIAEKMAEKTEWLLAKYDDNEDFSTWDFISLAEEIEMDIYIIDANNIIQFSNVTSELGLDFSKCCKRLSEELHARRNSGQLYIDEIDIDQQNEQIKKFSYKATEDKQYLIELGYNLENEEAFQQFNFIDVIDDIVEQSSVIHAIHILNFGGNAYGKHIDSDIPNNRRASFEKVRESLRPLEVEDTYHNSDVLVKYIPFESSFDEGATSFKVVEIIYDYENVNPYLETNYHEFIIQIIIIAIFTLIASSLIANWFSKPIHYAYHDSLTKLKNRAAFDDLLDDVMEENNRLYMLFILDLDNFKLVNDRYGHAAGDKLLKAIGKKIEEITMGDAFRLGGDEFAIIREIDEDFIVDDKAQFILQQLNQVISSNKETDELSVSVSMGIACTNAVMTKDILYKQADQALYEAKEKGKNQYKIFGEMN